MTIYRMNCKGFLLLWAMGWPGTAAQVQEPATKQGGAIQVAVGVGFHEGKAEQGLGLQYALGYQLGLGSTARWRLNPKLMYGEFSSGAITDTPDQFYRTTSAGLMLHYDVVRYRAVALTVAGGAFVTYSRGLLGTGGELQSPTQGSRYFHQLYGSVGGSVGFRVSPAKSRLAYEFHPIAIQSGSRGFLLVQAMLGLAVQLRK